MCLMELHNLFQISIVHLDCFLFSYHKEFLDKHSYKTLHFWLISLELNIRYELLKFLILMSCQIYFPVSLISSMLLVAEFSSVLLLSEFRVVLRHKSVPNNVLRPQHGTISRISGLLAFLLDLPAEPFSSRVSQCFLGI